MEDILKYWASNIIMFLDETRPTDATGVMLTIYHLGCMGWAVFYWTKLGFSTQDPHHPLHPNRFSKYNILAMTASSLAFLFGIGLTRTGRAIWRKAFAGLVLLVLPAVVITFSRHLSQS